MLVIGLSSYIPQLHPKMNIVDAILLRNNKSKPLTKELMEESKKEFKKEPRKKRESQHEKNLREKNLIIQTQKNKIEFLENMVKALTFSPHINIKYKLTRPGAMKPTQGANSSGNVGYDVASVECVSEIGNIRKYATGVAFNMPRSNWIWVVPRSSFPFKKYGWEGEIGIIDPNYQGEVHTVVRKHDKNAVELEDGFIGFQLIICPVIKADFQESNEEWEKSDRGEKGFGSTTLAKKEISEENPSIEEDIASKEEIHIL